MFQCLSQLYHKSVSLIRAVVITSYHIAKLLANNILYNNSTGVFTLPRGLCKRKFLVATVIKRMAFFVQKISLCSEKVSCLHLT